jgi:hypothetical protein
MMLKEAERLPDNLGINLVSQVCDAGNARILYERVSQVFGNGLAEKYNQNGNGEHRADTMNLAGKKRIQVNRFVREGICHQEKPRIGSSWIENAIEDRRDHQGNKPFREAHQGKAHDAGHKPNSVRLDVPKQSLEFSAFRQEFSILNPFIVSRQAHAEPVSTGNVVQLLSSVRYESRAFLSRLA